MKKVICCVCIIIFSTFLPFIGLKAEETSLKGGVSLIEQVPTGFFGHWKVYSELSYTNTTDFFAPYSIDYWTISRVGDILTLTNPESGANASLSINKVTGNTIVFIRTKKTNAEDTVEIPTLTITGENFYGKDKIVIKKYKYSTLEKEHVVEFIVRGEKISGDKMAQLLRKY